MDCSEKVLASQQKEKKIKRAVKRKMKKTKKKGAKRLTKVQVRELRQARLEALARPKAIRLQPWPNPELVRTLPVPVPASALYGPIPERIHELAKPKKVFLRHTVCKKNVRGPSDLAENPAEQPTRKPAKRVPRTFSRTELLAQPRPARGRLHTRCAKIKQENLVFCYPARQRVQVGSKDWIHHQKWLEKNAKPKRVFRRPVEAKVRSTMTRQQMEDSVNRLSEVPAHRQYSKKVPTVHKTKPARPHGPIVPLDLPFVNRLSVPKKLKQETLNDLEYDPQKRFRKSRYYKATPRIIELAKPILRKEPTEKQKIEDAFKVKRRALRARCSRRIKELAKPIIRK